jgi:hypothetical protein
LRKQRIRTALLVACFTAVALTGYWISDRVGAEALRLEAQEQLARLMEGEVRIGRARLVIRGGLFIEGERVGVYPQREFPHQPALFASHVSAELDVFALLTGRFRLASLTLEDALLKIERDAAGRWTPSPFERAADEIGDDVLDDMERSLDLAGVIDGITRWLLEEGELARRVELRGCRVDFRDAHAPGPNLRPLQLSLHDINGRLSHPWLGGTASLELSALLATQSSAAVPIRLEGGRRRDQDLRISLVASELPLSILEHYVAPADSGTYLSGFFSGELAYETDRADHGRIRLLGMAEELSTIILVRSGRFEIDRPIVHLESTIEIHPGRVRLSDGHIDAEGFLLELDAGVERPIRRSSRMRVDARASGLDLDEVRELARSLPSEDVETLDNLLSRAQEGRIDRVGGSGVARLREWADLFTGELDRLPESLLLSAELSGIDIPAGPGDVLRELRGRIELSGDHLALRHATASWNEDPLPTLDLTIDGVSHLINGPEGERPSSASTGTLPGIGALWKVIDEHRASDSAPDPKPTRVAVHIDSLLHPVLRWPLRDADIVVVPTSSGATIRIERALYAGAPIRGNAVWRAEPGNALRIDLEVSEGETRDARAARRERPAARASSAWGLGHFALSRLGDASSPMPNLAGSFELRQSTLELSNIEAKLRPSGQLDANASLDLAREGRVGLGLTLSITDGDVTELGEAVGLPARFATGRVALAANMKGRLRPGQALLAEMNGSGRIDARDGEIRQKELPLVVALAQASQGYNEWAQRDALVYESAIGDLLLTQGRIATPDFRIEGPLRIFASGEIDVARAPHRIQGLVAVFLFRAAGQLMETLPLVKAILPGSEKGLVGAYYKIGGDFSEPSVDPLRSKSFEEDLPDLLAAPYKVLQAIFGRGWRKSDPEESDERTAASKGKKR